MAPEMAMDRDEAKELAKAITDVNRHYNIRLLDQKMTDWVCLLQVVGIAYGGRLMAIRSRHKKFSRGPVVVPIRPQETPTPARPNADEINAAMNSQNREPTSQEMRAGEIPGVGVVVFPENDPLAPKKFN